MTETYKHMTFPSAEEMHMYQWLEEAQAHGIVRQFIHQPAPYVLSVAEKYDFKKQLKTKVKTVEKSLLNKHIYTADFAIYTDHVMPLDKQFQNQGIIVIDVKGGFQQYDGQRSFSINQKWVYSKFGIYVHKVVPEEFFKRTFVPEGALYTPKTRNIKKCYRGVELVAEYAEILRGR